MSSLFDHPEYLVVYIIVSLALSFFLSKRLVQWLFLLVNVLFIFVIFFYNPLQSHIAFYLSVYLIFALSFWILLKIKNTLKIKSKYASFWMVFVAWVPVLGLFGIRLIPMASLADYSVIFGSWIVPFLAQSGLYHPYELLGLSYFSFRMTLYSLETFQNQTYKQNFLLYLNYIFFLPLFVVGPISSYSKFEKTFLQQKKRNIQTFLIAIERIIVGLTKFYFLSAIFYQFTFTRLIQTNSLHLNNHLFISVVSYTFYIYLNFSGFCDFIIGLCALLGFECQENFSAPLFSTNIRAFWNSWHISLTNLLKILVFNPISKMILTKFKSNSECKSETKGETFAVIIGTFFVFLLMGAWHGFHVHFFIFSGLHFIALTAYQLIKPIRVSLTLRFSKSKYLEIFYKIFSQLVTFSYVSFAFFFFENNIEQIRKILSYNSNFKFF